MKELVQQLLAIENFDVFLVLRILIFFGLIESFAGYLRHSKRKRRLVTRNFKLLLSLFRYKTCYCCLCFLLGKCDVSEGGSLLSQQSFIAMGYILIDDLLQYWYHRSAHEYPFLWKLHRSHHQAEKWDTLFL